MEDQEAETSSRVEISVAGLFVRLALICYSGMLGMAVVFFVLREGSFLPYKYISGNIPLKHQIAWGFLAGLVVIGLSRLGSYLSSCVRRAEYDIKALFGNLSSAQIWIIAGCSSVGEEFFFRAALQPSLGIWLTSAIFGALHLPPTRNMLFYPFVTVVIGLGLGWLFIESGEGLCAPVLAHFLINLAGLSRINRLPAPEFKTPDF